MTKHFPLNKNSFYNYVPEIINEIVEKPIIFKCNQFFLLITNAFSLVMRLIKMLSTEEVYISEDPPILLKKATLNDMEFIKGLLRTEMDKIVNEAWKGRFRWESWYNDITEAFSLDSHLIQLIQISDQKIGFLWMNKEVDTLWITSIVLKKAWQRQNIGYQIMTFLINECRQNGIKSIELGVQQNNDAAMNFYLSMGFSKFDQVRSASTDLLRLSLKNSES